MMPHGWSTYRRTTYHQHDECLCCDAIRWRGINTGWNWRYRRGGKTCTGRREKVESR